VKVIWFRRSFVCFILLSFLSVLLPCRTILAADPYTTTSVKIIKLAPDGITKLSETTISYETMKNTLPVQGDGITHYWTQGPSYLDENWWDPAEKVNLYDKGALKGTNLKDLCDLVGGMNIGDTVKVHAKDNYGNDMYSYSNVYTPDSRQGKMVICWYNNSSGGSPGYVPGFSTGMLLAFFTTVPNADGKLVFGNNDMRDCIPEANWHWNEGFPSVHGLYCKYVSEITIYTSPKPAWTLNLYGARNQAIPQAEFENAQGENCHGVTPYTDVSGTWKGMPLWMLTAFVDDTTGIHGEGSYNDGLAAAGYAVKVIGEDGSYTFQSTDIARNNNIILANQLNGGPLPDDSYPLKLVGTGLTAEAQRVGKIYRIELHDIPVIPQWNLRLHGVNTLPITQTLFEQCTMCHSGDGVPIIYNDGQDTWSGIPLWYFSGWVDDDNEHGHGSYNDDLADTGYSIQVNGASGRMVLNSDDVSRSSHYLLADRKNGEALTGDQYPLALVGTGIPSGRQVFAVDSVQLVFGQPWDLNGDHICNIADVVKLGEKWGLTGIPGWIKEDLNADGNIGVADLTVLGRYWGHTW
jgi:hypothetical protein